MVSSGISDKGDDTTVPIHIRLKGREKQTMRQLKRNGRTERRGRLTKRGSSGEPPKGQAENRITKRLDTYHNTAAISTSQSCNAVS